MRRKFYFLFLTIFIFSGLASSAFAQNNFSKEAEIYFFYSAVCPHCAEEKVFLGQLEEKYPEIEIKKLNVSEKENIDLLEKLYKEYNVPSEVYGLVPITFIEEQYFLGFNEKIGEDIENYIIELINKIPQEPEPQPDKRISLPFIGEINLSEFSPLFLAVVLGALDGFNICSIGALVLILGLVLALRSRIKILIYGSAFIITTAVVYGLLIVLWYKLFSFLAPYLKIMEILIGLLGVGGGIYFFRQFLKFKKYGPTCEMDTGKGIAAQFTLKIQELIKRPGNVLFVLGSILLFAFVITVVEFPCSAFIPVAFAGALAQFQLSTFQYLLYIAIFIFFYMIEELIIFLVAVFTATLWLASRKFITWITLIEAVILFLFGIYYLFASIF